MSEIRQVQCMGIMAHSRGAQPNLLEWLKKDFLEEGWLGPQVAEAGVFKPGAVEATH